MIKLAIVAAFASGLAGLAGLSCGPSTRDVALAKVARYHGDKLVLFKLARQVTEKKYALVQSDETQLVILTKGRWYTPEGLASHWQPDDLKQQQDNPLGPNRPLLVDKSLYMKFTVKLLPDAENWIVYVEPKISRYNQGMPNLEPVNPTHADVPGWATGKVDTLSWEIHKALHKYQVVGLTGSTPPPPPYIDPNDAGVGSANPDEVLPDLPPRDAGEATGPPP